MQLRYKCKLFEPSVSLFSVALQGRLPYFPPYTYLPVTVRSWHLSSHLDTLFKNQPLNSHRPKEMTIPTVFITTGISATVYEAVI